MSKISDTRLEELIRLELWTACPSADDDVVSALRELRDYRKAVREYLGFVDEWEKDNSHLEPDERAALDRACRRDLEAAEATLRALKERT